MRLRFILIGTLALMTVSCTDQDWEPTPGSENSEPTRTVRQRTLDEALACADEMVLTDG